MNLSAAENFIASPAPSTAGLGACEHCGGPLLSSVQYESSRFCCPGCATTYQTLHTLGLGSFYSLRSESRIQGVKVTEQAIDASLFDTEAFSSKHVEQVSEEVSRVRLLLHGIHCVGCVWVLDQLPHLLNGIRNVELSFSDGVLLVEFDPNSVKLSQLALLLSQLGYAARPCTSADRIEREQQEDKEFLLRIGVAAFGFGNTMVIAASLYQGYFTGIDQEIRNFLHWVSLLISFPVVLYAGRPFFQSLATSIRTKRLHMDVPIAIGIITILSYSLWNTFIGAERVYFDSVCALVFLLLLGRFFQHKALSRARRSLLDELELLPMSAKVRREGTLINVPQWDIRASDTVLVPVGARVPIDGILEAGESSFNTAVMTGESLPQALRQSDAVYAGYLNLEREVSVRPSGNAEDTRLNKLLKLLNDGAMQRTPLVESADKILGWFVAAVLCAAVATLLIWIPYGVQATLDAVVSLLVICCPCALALATPLALASGVRRAAAAGILIRRAEVIERSARIRRIFFDKTGTVTSGQLSVAQAQFSPEFSSTAPNIAWRLSVAGASHPASSAIRSHLARQRQPIAEEVPDSQTQVIAGAGVRFSDDEGHEWRLGNERFALLAPTEPTLNNSYSRVFLSIDQKLAAEFELSDTIPLSTRTTLQSLRDSGYELTLLSGDSIATVTSIGTELGFSKTSIIAEASPEGKLKIVREAGSGAMMVGDGINDAAALGAADVGVAVRGDALRCLESSDVALVDSGIEGVEALLRGSKRVVRVVRENLAISLIYNVVGAALAIAGKIDPLLAALLMPISSLTVLANSHFRETFPAKPD